jgi:uncharacterized membrane protein
MFHGLKMAGQRKKHGKGLFMMNHTVGWMGGWAGGQMLIWAVLAILVVVVVVIKSMIRKK